MTQRRKANNFGQTMPRSSSLIRPKSAEPKCMTKRSLPMFMRERAGHSPAIRCLLRDGSWQLDLPRRGFEDEQVCLCGATSGSSWSKSTRSTLASRSGTSLRACAASALHLSCNALHVSTIASHRDLLLDLAAGVGLGGKSEIELWRQIRRLVVPVTINT